MNTKTCTNCHRTFTVKPALAHLIDWCAPCSLSDAPHTRAASPMPVAVMPLETWRRALALSHPDRFADGTREHAQAVHVSAWLLAHKPEGAC
jgi:hypothetical protein